MKKIKIFVASSGSLSEERSSIETFLSRKNDELVEKGIYLEVKIWEKLSSGFTQERKQDEFNSVVVSSDIFICLVFDRVGVFTHEEFQKAYESFKENDKPSSIYVYFKESSLKPSEIPKDFSTILELKEEIKGYEQIYNDYENIADLLLKIDHNLKFDLHKFTTSSVKEKLDSLLDEMNPQIRQLFHSNVNPVPLLIHQENLERLSKMKEELEREKFLRYETHGIAAISSSGFKVEGWINDKKEGFNLYCKLYKLENY